MRVGSKLSVAAMVLTLVAAAARATQPSGVDYHERAPFAQYLMESQDAEVALARTAAPLSIAEKSDVMVLQKAGYRTVIKGTNGFVCMVWRSWSDDLADEQFWNAKVRAPICLNSIAVRTVLPDYLRRTAWVISGVTLAEMRARFAAAASRGELQIPAPGAMSYMMSRQGYLADGVGHASPHIMFFVPRTDGQDWGANLAGSPIWGAQAAPDPVAMFFVTVPRWSDGTPALAH